MPQNATDSAADYAIEHTIKLQRVGAGMRNDALAVLVDLEEELSKIVMADGGTAPNSAKYRAMQAEAKAAIASAYKVIARQQDKGLAALATVEWSATNAQINAAIGVELVSGKIPPKILEAVTQAPVVLGSPARDWWAGQDADMRVRFQREMATGTLLGETNAELTRRVVGAGILKQPEPGSPPGLFAKARRDAEALVHTSVQSISNHARLESFKAKPGLIKGVQWLATLDTRTTLICIGLDGKAWRLPDYQPVGHDKAFPGATAHWRCRSTQIAVLYSWKELSGKKLPELDNKKLQDRIDQKLRAAGKTEAQILAATANTRASMDGQVSKGKTYETWAKAKGKDYVEQVLGPGRAALFDAGQITFSDLTDQHNRPLTIAQLEESVATGKQPPETLGVDYLPLTKPARYVDVQATANKAAKEAVAEQAKKLKALNDDLSAAEVAMEAAGEKLTHAIKQLQAGKTAIAELLDAQAALEAAQRQITAAQAALAKATATP